LQSFGKEAGGLLTAPDHSIDSAVGLRSV